MVKEVTKSDNLVYIFLKQTDQMKKIAFLTLMLCSTTLFAQNDSDDEFAAILKYKSDANKIFTAYLAPVVESFNVGLNQGWYNTAKAHKTLGFDLTVTASALQIPNDKMFYTPSKLGLQSVQYNDTDSPNASTLVGPDTEAEYFVDGNSVIVPGGLNVKEEYGYNIVPVPMITLDIKLRYVPDLLDEENVSYRFYGIGVMHDLKQYIPGIKNRLFDFSGFIGYTHIGLDYNFEGSGVNGANQRAEFRMSATTIQGIISKKFSVLTLYGAAGYNIAQTSVGAKGTYDFDGDNNISENEVDPLTLKFGSSGPRVTAGFRLKLAILSIHADYTLQTYSALTVGLGLTVR
jgi:hypothetical protein